MGGVSGDILGEVTGVESIDSGISYYRPVNFSYITPSSSARNCMAFNSRVDNGNCLNNFLNVRLLIKSDVNVNSGIRIKRLFLRVEMYNTSSKAFSAVASK